ncbi:MAG TPA: hypothetical protein VL068_00085 [Microthrixaceae bacterium]|nr:hypothetical protein [Microthrixaceae bacterium]
MNTPHKMRFRTSAVALVSVLALSGGVLAACDSQPGNAGQATSTTVEHDHGGDQTAKVEINSAMRTLWAEHMQWTYDTVVAFAAGSEGLTPTMERLLANQEQIGAAIEPFYGEAAAAQLTELLKTHINDAVPVLTAAKAGDSTALQTALDEWYRNAREIGDFLATANPGNWDKAEMEEMMEMHITQTVAYASAQLGGDFAGAIAKYDEAASHMADMADMLSSGIIQQFPDKF